MKNLRKVIESAVAAFVEENPPPADVGFTSEEALAAAGEFLDVLDGIASVARSLDRIATVLEREELRVASQP